MDFHSGRFGNMGQNPKCMIFCNVADGNLDHKSSETVTHFIYKRDTAGLVFGIQTMVLKQRNSKLPQKIKRPVIISKLKIF